MKMSLSTSKLSYPEPTREFFPAIKTTNPGQPFCGPAQLSAASGYESLVKSESDSVDRVPDELWNEVHDIVQETGTIGLQRVRHD